MTRARRRSGRPAPAAPAASGQRPPARADRGGLLGVIAAVAAAGALHAESLRAPFFADDWLFLDQVRGRSLAEVLMAPDPIGNYFRPLGRQVWFWLVSRLGGESAVVFHAANLALFALALVLLARLATRRAGAFAGVVAAAFLAVHHAASVPVLWASGSQELLALVLGLLALDLHVSGRRAGAAVAFLGALLAKESILLLPVAAIALDERPGPFGARVRRAAPLFAALVAWGGVVAWRAFVHGAPGAGLALRPDGPFAVPVLLARVAAGLEWRTGGVPLLPPRLPDVAALLALAAAVLAPVLARRVAGAGEGASAGRATATHGEAAAARRAPAAGGVRAGLVWALAGALPVAAVAPLWSGYYFLFALAGVGLMLGAAVARARRPVLAAAVALALAGWASLQARALQEFATAPSAWSAQSHVNRFYLLRGMRVVERVVGSLRAMAPIERHTTFFVAGLPSFAAIQVADGPLVRSVFVDSTLRSHYLSEITPGRLGRGPWRILFYDPVSGRLEDHSRDPQVLLSTALGMVLSDRLEVAAATLDAAAARGGPDVARDYVAGFVGLARGDSARALASLARAGFRAGRGGAAAAARAEPRIAAGDTLGAAAILRAAVRADVLEPALHARLADLLLARPATRPDGQLEAFAARVLEPGRGLAWRRWAFVLATENRPERALEALDRYVQLDPELAAVDTRARDLRTFLGRTLPGGDLAQRSMRRELDR